MSQKFKIIFTALVIFFGGAVCGGFGAASVSMGAPTGGEEGYHGKGGRKGMKDPKKFAARIQEKLQSKLELTPDQGKQLAVILDKAANEAEAQHEQMRSKQKANREQITKEIESILDDNQKAKFAELKKKFEKKREKFKDRIKKNRSEG